MALRCCEYRQFLWARAVQHLRVLAAAALSGSDFGEQEWFRFKPVGIQARDSAKIISCWLPAYQLLPHYGKSGLLLLASVLRVALL